MHTITLNVKDNVFDKIIYFLKNLPKDEVEIIEDKVVKENEDIDYWSEEELKNFGKYSVGLSSNDFDDEDEDYSKW